MSNTLFPLDAPELEWSCFRAEGYPRPVNGVVYRSGASPCCGVALGGIGTGCFDIDPRGIYGFSSIFNPIGPRPGYPGQLVPRLLPRPEALLGLAVGEKTWLLVTPEILDSTELEWCTEPDRQVGQGGRDLLRVPVPPVENVESATEIHYWGHYPVADLEFETGAPVTVGMRAWAPFIPGDATASNIPAIIFEARVRNSGSTRQTGTLAFNFPGPQKEECPAVDILRTELQGEVSGVLVNFPESMSYLLGVLEGRECRFGTGLYADPSSWSRIADTLPESSSVEVNGLRRYRDPSSSAAVDFDLAPGGEVSISFVLSWYAPVLKGITKNWPEEIVEQHGQTWIRWIGENRQGSAHYFTQMYAARYGNATEVARRIQKEHGSLLSRIISWQSAIYDAPGLPPWLGDSLVNNLYLIAETSRWVQAREPLGDWAFPGGAFALDESPRGCPHLSCIPCDWYGSFPITAFFPELALSTLTAFREYQLESGEIPFALGKIDIPDFAVPEYYWQVSLNGFCYIDLVDRFWQATGNDSLVTGFYESVKKCNDFTMGLHDGPGAAVTMPDIGGMEWFEFGEWAGIATHMGGLRLAGLKMVERMAHAVGDADYAARCASWYDEGISALESEMWNGDCYDNFRDAATGRESDAVMAYQLDGEWTARIHGLPGVFPAERVSRTLDTIEGCNIALTPDIGAANFTQPDGRPMPADDPVAFYGSSTMFCSELLVLAMTYMQAGRIELGLSLAHRHWRNLFLAQRHPWDLPNMVDGKTGERLFGTDYSQDMMLWFLPAAIEGHDIETTCSTEGLIGRVVAAGAVTAEDR